MQRDNSIDLIKAILIILVLVGHHIQFVCYQGSDGFWSDPLFKLIYIFHMPLFMAVSGYVAGFGLERSSVGTHARKKSLQLVLPMAFWCVIGVLAAFPDISGAAGFGRMWAASMLGTYWFLWAVFFSYLITRCALYLPVRPQIALPMVAIVLILMPLPFYVYAMTCYLFPFFAAGYLTHVCGYRIQPTRQVVSLLLVLAVAVFALWSRHTYIYNNRLHAVSVADIFDIGLMFLGGAVFSLSVIWACLAAANVLKSEWVTEQMAGIGQATLQIYLVQDVYFKMLKTAELDLPPVITWTALFPASFALTVLITILFFRTRHTRTAPLIWGVAARGPTVAANTSPATAS